MRVTGSGCAVPPVADEDDASIRSLMAQFPRAGEVRWIGLRARRGPVAVVDAAQAIAGAGLAGDHRAARPGGSRQVTLIQAEHLPVVAGLLGRREVDPAWLRRNLVVAGVNLLALKGCEVRIGQAVLRHTGPCHPCSRMEASLGRGGYNAMRGHGGITAQVIAGGVIRVGDRVEVGPA